MIFLSSAAATLVFLDHSEDIIHINISTSVGVELTNATSDVLNHYTIEASLKKDAQVAYITVKDVRRCSARRARRIRGFNPHRMHINKYRGV